MWGLNFEEREREERERGSKEKKKERFKKKLKKKEKLGYPCNNAVGDRWKQRGYGSGLSLTFYGEEMVMTLIRALTVLPCLSLLNISIISIFIHSNISIHTYIQHRAGP